MANRHIVLKKFLHTDPLMWIFEEKLKFEKSGTADLFELSKNHSSIYFVCEQCVISA
jgi:hypothetical protein